MLVVREQLHVELDGDEPATAERDLGPSVVTPYEALPEAIGGREPLGIPLEDVAEPRAADLLGALADPEDRDRRLSPVRVEPVVDRLQPCGYVRLVVAGAPFVDGAITELGAEGIAVPRGKIAWQLEAVVVRVDDDPSSHASVSSPRMTGTPSGVRSTTKRSKRRRTRSSTHRGHALDGHTVAADGRDAAGLAPFVDEAVGVARGAGSPLGGKRVGIRGQHLGPVVGHQDDVLEPDAAVSLPGDSTRLHRHDVSSHQLPSCKVDGGSSWTSSPTPWPRPWKNPSSSTSPGFFDAAWDSHPPRLPLIRSCGARGQRLPGRIAVGAACSCTSRQSRW